MTELSLSAAEPRKLVPRLLHSGVKAPQVLIEAAVDAQLKAASDYVAGLPPRETEEQLEATVARVIRAHRTLARAEGAAAGVAMTTAEVTSVAGSAGTLTLPAAAITLAGDLAGLAWIQIRMALIVAALYGHDMTEKKTRLKELLTLTGVYGAGPAASVGEMGAAASQRVLKRLLMRHLKGAPLQAIKGMFRVVGINFARAGVIRMLPAVNILVNAAVNDAATAAMGSKARAYYKELPAPSPKARSDA